MFSRESVITIFFNLKGICMKSSMGLLAILKSIASAVQGGIMSEFNATQYFGSLYRSRGKGKGGGQASFKYRSSGKRFPECGSRAADRQKRQGLRNVMVNGFMLIQKA